MTICELLSEELQNPFETIIWEDTNDNDEVIIESKTVSPLDYDRKWIEYPKNEKHYSKKTGNRLYGYWQYKHISNANNGKRLPRGYVVHHKDGDKHNNKKSNLQIVTRSEHCKIDPNARKCYKCKICGGEHYSHHLCKKHYMQKFRKGEFGNYDKSKNYSKEDR